MPLLLLLDFCIAAMDLVGLGFADDDPTGDFKVPQRSCPTRYYKTILSSRMRRAFPPPDQARDAGPIAPNANTTNTDNVTARAAPLG